MLIPLQTTATARTVVDATNTAAAVGSGLLPVFATPMMIALMENAAAQAVSPYLEKGQATVGTAISVSHDKASGMGSQIIATATIVNVDRRRIDFEVEATADGELIGKGTHSRFIVDTDRFMDKLKS